MTRRTIGVTLLLCVVIVGGGVWYSYTQSQPSTPQISIQPHGYMTSTGYQCIHEVMPYILQKTHDPLLVRMYLQHALENMRHVTMRWKHPGHVHCSIQTAQPLIQITTDRQTWVISDNGSCIPYTLMPQRISERLPRLSWQSTQDPCTLTKEITQLYHNIPRAWWNQYQIVWHTPHDIRLHSHNKQDAHIRTTADRTITTALQKQINRIKQDEAPATQTWIDIRHDQHAIVYPKIRGR